MSLQSVGDYIKNQQTGYLGRIFVASRVERAISELLGLSVRVIFRDKQFTLICHSAAVAKVINMRRPEVTKMIRNHYRGRGWRLVIKVKSD